MKIKGIYKIVNKINGKFYIGSSVNIKIRWYRHITELLRNVHKNTHLQRAWNKYGRYNFVFEIITTFPPNTSDDIILQEEQKLLNVHYGNSQCYNLTKGVTDLNGSNNPFYGKHHTDETRKSLSDTALQRPKIFGRKHSNETIVKISLNRTGKTCGNKHRQYDQNIYRFKKDDEIFEGTRFDFCKKYNLNKGNVCWLVKGKNKSVNGWIMIIKK
jgi:group I intron endonuclease